jgi:hypothetical protein
MRSGQGGRVCSGGTTGGSVGLKVMGARRKVVVSAIGFLAAGGALFALGPSAAGGSVHASAIRFKYITGQHSWQGHVTSDTPGAMY